MKKLKLNLSVLPVLILMMAFSLTGFGQAPYFMSYQAVIRDAGNQLVTNAPIGMKVSILQGSATGTAVFEETHVANTDANGLVTIMIGNGANVSGSIATIIWTAGPFFIMTETDPAGGSTYTITATTQLLSVPYALYAETSGSSTPGPEGPMGPQGPVGPEGPQGPAGQGMTVNCLQCHDHNPATQSATGMAALIANAQLENQFSKHAEGLDLAIEEGYSAGCAPCHSNEGFHSVVDNNTIPTYILGTNNKYTFSYNALPALSTNLPTMPTGVGCWTCHKGAAADSMALYTVAPVPMTMWAMPGNTKTIDITQNGSESNLCVKCHQPRPMNTSSTLSNGASVDYNDLALNPMNMFYDSAFGNAQPNKLIPSYRTHNHYGTVGAIFGAKGAVEFAGALSYDNTSAHALEASCQDCHMATPTGFTGGHSFWMSYVNEESGAKSYNFKGCNKTGCHTNMSATNATWTGTRANTLDLLLSLADKLRSGGIEIMHKNPDFESNPFALVTPAGYDGYLDIFDPSTNPDGALRNPAPANSWTNDQKAYNLTLPKLTSLLNVQMGAIINFQLSLREYSLGVHNPAYSQAVLNNTLDALTAAGF
jgi:hypothetical protein